MTDRIRVLLVHLDRDTREDELEGLTEAIGMLRGVSGVTLAPVTTADILARQTVRLEYERQVMEAIHSVFEGKPWTPEKRD